MSETLKFNLNQPKKLSSITYNNVNSFNQFDYNFYNHLKFLF